MKISKRGQRPSVESVLQQLGHGGSQTVMRHLRSYWRYVWERLNAAKAKNSATGKKVIECLTEEEL